MYKILFLIIIIVIGGGGYYYWQNQPVSSTPTANYAEVNNTEQSPQSERPAWMDSNEIRGFVWADNWFELYLDGELIATDSVPITTERSFNAEQFSFGSDSRPAQLAFVVKDFKENDTGLEYIGSRKQQMGDGGLIAQFIDAGGNIVAVTDADTKCIVTHHAPVDTACADSSDPQIGSGACASRTITEPDGWKLAGFDDSSWDFATIYTEDDVRPKDGYDEVSWNTRAELVWSSDLERDNTLLCRITLQ